MYKISIKNPDTGRFERSPKRYKTKKDAEKVLRGWKFIPKSSKKVVKVL